MLDEEKAIRKSVPGVRLISPINSGRSRTRQELFRYIMLTVSMCFNYLVGHKEALDWPATLEISALRAEGWTPAPFREFIVKVHSRCNLSCDYCYMYEMADQSWRTQPRKMSPEVADLTAMRIGEHARSHGLDRVSLILHGGEPLLAGQDLITRLVTATRHAAGPSVAVDVSIQTNAIRLSDAYLRLFDELRVRVGVSVDGDAVAQDRHRKYTNGRGSYTAVSESLTRLQRFPHLYGGLLSTIDLRNDPARTYGALVRFAPPRLDFLLPHGTWTTPPPGRSPDDTATPYADWLICVFDTWYPRPAAGIRLFEEIMQLLLGGTSNSEMVGLAPTQLVVIETDGSVAQEDTLKVAFDGAVATGLHLSRDPLDAALLLPGVAARQIGARALPEGCRTCPVHQVCGGGLYTHRYRAGSGFLNPSVYCPDLKALIGHISARLQADITSRRAREAAG